MINRNRTHPMTIKAIAHPGRESVVVIKLEIEIRNQMETLLESDEDAKKNAKQSMKTGIDKRS